MKIRLEPGSLHHESVPWYPEVRESLGSSPGHGAESLGLGIRIVIFRQERRGKKMYNIPVFEDAGFLVMLMETS